MSGDRSVRGLIAYSSYMSGLMPRVFFAFAQVCHMGVPFKLWVICTI